MSGTVRSRGFWGAIAALGPIVAGLALAPLGAGGVPGRAAPPAPRPGTQALVAAITFAAGKNGANIDRGLQQVLAGGRAQDSRYTCRRWDGRSAEIFTGPGSPSYIYLRLDRRSRLFLARPKVLYVTVTWAAAEPPTALLARGGCGLAVQYNSTFPGLAGTYRNTPAIYPKAGEAGWQTYTWKLQDAHLTGRQNGNADLRLAGAPGFAVHQVTVSAAPPAVTAVITFATGRGGVNIGHGLHQVMAGGQVGDSRYACCTLDGKTAEVLLGPGIPSYIYLRLGHDSRLFLSRLKVLYVTVTWAAAGPPTALLARGSCGLAVQYNSTFPGLAGTYRNTPAIYPKAGEAGWQTYTWKLQDAHLTGRQNGNADLRLAGAPGFAVHQVMLGALALRRRGH